MPWGHSVCSRPPLFREGFLSGLQILYWYNSLLLHLPAPTSAAFQIEGDSLGEGKHEVPTGTQWSPRAGTTNTMTHAQCQPLACGQEKRTSAAISAARPTDGLYSNSRNSCFKATCLEKAKRPLTLRIYLSVIACGVCSGTVAQCGPAV